MYNVVSIGIDQSYANTGISVAADGKLLDVKSVHLDKYKSNSARRAALKSKLGSLIAAVAPKSKSIVCIVERARIHGGETSFINIDAIKAMGALTATIVDACDEYGIPVYSVDTRCWKSQVVGTSKPKPNKYGVPPEKWPTVVWACRRGFEKKLLIDLTDTRKTKGTFVKDGKRYMYNNDAADSAAISMYWFIGNHEKLKPEK